MEKWRETGINGGTPGARDRSRKARNKEKLNGWCKGRISEERDKWMEWKRWKTTERDGAMERWREAGREGRLDGLCEGMIPEVRGNWREKWTLGEEQQGLRDRQMM